MRLFKKLSAVLHIDDGVALSHEGPCIWNLPYDSPLFKDGRRFYILSDIHDVLTDLEESGSADVFFGFSAHLFDEVRALFHAAGLPIHVSIPAGDEHDYQLHCVINSEMQTSVPDTPTPTSTPTPQSRTLSPALPDTILSVATTPTQKGKWDTHPRCAYIYRHGKQKGKQCTTRVRNQQVSNLCSTHRK